MHTLTAGAFVIKLPVVFNRLSPSRFRTILSKQKSSKRSLGETQVFLAQRENLGFTP
jgi:hypothetical protein